MFGLFKKPDTIKTTDECLQTWNLMNERDKATSAKNILKYSEGLAELFMERRISGAPFFEDGTAALTMLGHCKQSVIRKYSLRDHMHPAYMEVQILSDYIYSKKMQKEAHDHARSVIDKITSRLNSSDKEEVYKNLDIFSMQK